MLGKIVAFSLLLLTGCSSTEENCESEDGISLSASCLASTTELAEQGNTGAMYRLYFYWDATEDRKKAADYFRKAAFGGLIYAENHALSSCHPGGIFSIEEGRYFAQKLSNSDDRKMKLTALKFYLGLECDSPKFDLAEDVIDAFNLTGTEACRISLSYSEKFGKERNFQFPNKLLKPCLDHGAGTKFYQYVIDELNKSKAPLVEEDSN